MNYLVQIGGNPQEFTTTDGLGKILSDGIFPAELMLWADPDGGALTRVEIDPDSVRGVSRDDQFVYLEADVLVLCLEGDCDGGSLVYGRKVDTVHYSRQTVAA